MVRRRNTNAATCFFFTALLLTEGTQATAQVPMDDPECVIMIKLARDGKYPDALRMGEKCESAAKNASEYSLKYATVLNKMSEIYGKDGQYEKS